MNRLRYTTVFATATCAFACAALATDRFYSDITAASPSGRYKVEAKSPDNAGGKGRKAFQASFTYTCRDAQTRKVLWTRQQAMEEPQSSEPGSGRTFIFPKEASPVAIFVSDTGWTVIRTAWDELVAVDVAGKDRGRVRLLTDGFTKEEQAEYVHDTTAGPMWSGYALWYFVDADSQQFFVVRPWWGRRVVMSMQSGTLVKETTGISSSAARHEERFVLAELSKGIATRKSWEKEECCELVWPVLRAAYLAGKLRVQQAVPLLRQLEDSTYSGSSASGSSAYKPPEGGVDPSNWEEMTMRRVVHLSLRPLGSPPSQYACTTFDVHFKDYRRERRYDAPTLAHARIDRADSIRPGMKPEDVLALIGAPDANDSATWHYDMDAADPYTLSVQWAENGVGEVKRKSPALWTTDIWDQELVY